MVLVEEESILARPDAHRMEMKSPQKPQNIVRITKNSPKPQRNRKTVEIMDTQLQPTTFGNTFDWE